MIPVLGLDIEAEDFADPGFEVVYAVDYGEDGGGELSALFEAIAEPVFGGGEEEADRVLGIRWVGDLDGFLGGEAVLEAGEFDGEEVVLDVLGGDQQDGFWPQQDGEEVAEAIGGVVTGGGSGLDEGAAADPERAGDEAGHGEVVRPGGIGLLAEEGAELVVNLGFDHGGGCVGGWGAGGAPLRGRMAMIIGGG